MGAARIPCDLDPAAAFLLREARDRKRLTRTGDLIGHDIHVWLHRPPRLGPPIGVVRAGLEELGYELVVRKKPRAGQKPSAVFAGARASGRRTPAGVISYGSRGESPPPGNAGVGRCNSGGCLQGAEAEVVAAFLAERGATTCPPGRAQGAIDLDHDEFGYPRQSTLTRSNP